MTSPGKSKEREADVYPAVRNTGQTGRGELAVLEGKVVGETW